MTVKAKMIMVTMYFADIKRKQEQIVHKKGRNLTWTAIKKNSHKHFKKNL